MGQMGHNTTDVTREQARPRWRIRRGLLGAGALAAVGALAACSGVATNETQAADALSKLAATAAGGTVQSHNEPAIITHAIAHGRTARPSGQAEHRRPGHPTPSGSATATPAGPASGTPTSTPSGTPTTPSAPPASTPTGGQSGTDPSGQDPATTLSGYTLKYTQEFTGGTLPSGWGEYAGVPGGETSSEADWEPSMCDFSGGEARFMASGIDSCGMHYTAGPQEYGAWFARLQANAEPAGQLFTDIFLLWPHNNQWPPEIDVYEDEGNRSRTVATLWNTVGDACGASTSSSCLYGYTQTNGGGGGVANTDTEWHTYGVEWTPSGVSWLIDGKVIFTAPASAVKSPAQQPALTMDMALQSENLQGSPGASTTEDTMNVDWVEQFSWNG
jgi:glycosyl hydrolase family 16